MPSNDERREVAARLREEGNLRAFAEIVGFSWEDESDWLWHDVAVKYAELIEPEPERTCHMELRKHGAIYDVFYFDCCDEEYAESRTDQYASGISGRVCPYCGAKVVE